MVIGLPSGKEDMINLISVGNFCRVIFTDRQYMDYREQNIEDNLQRQGIVIATLKKVEKDCVVCPQKTLGVVGKGYDNRTNYVCLNKKCNCQFSLA